MLSLIPAVLWVWFFARKDWRRPEPCWLLARAFIAGSLAVLPAVLVQAPFRSTLVRPPGWIEHLLVSVLVVGLSEELFKFLAMWLSAYNRGEFDEIVDGIIYSVAGALGFSAVENVLFSLSFGLAIAPVRAFIASLAHISFSGIAGYYAGLARLGYMETAKAFSVGIGVAALLHGIYDFLIIGGALQPAFALLLLIITYWKLSGKIRSAIDVPPPRGD